MPILAAADTGKIGMCARCVGAISPLIEAVTCREPHRIDTIDFGECDRPLGHLQEVEQLEVLASLRHDSVVGSHDQEREIDSGDACEHIAHESLVTGHVDEADEAPAGQCQSGKAEVDGHSAFALFREVRCVRSGQRLDDCRLSVIDMPGGRDDHRVKPSGRKGRIDFTAVVYSYADTDPPGDRIAAGRTL